MNVVTGSSQSDPGQCWIQGRCFLMSYHDGGCVVRPLSLHLLSLNQCRLWGKAQLEMWTVCYKVKHGSLWSQLCQQDHTSGYCVQPLWRRLVSHSGRHNPSSKPKTVPSKGERSRLTLWCVCVCVCVCEAGEGGRRGEWISPFDAPELWAFLEAMEILCGRTISMVIHRWKMGTRETLNWDMKHFRSPIGPSGLFVQRDRW